jgi:formyltetrahydrofolate-dependent phosphoribosylglycinamide formyltransferase
LAVLASGNGTTLQNLIDRSRDGRLEAAVDLVISDQASAKALDRARDAEIAAFHVPYSNRQREESSRAVFDLCRQHAADLVVMAGYLKLLPIPDDFAARVVNVHPSLLPAFGGQGCFGHHVHKAVLDRGVKVTGCTVHFCDNQYDHGPIILQRVVDVLDDDTPKSLADRVQSAEREALPEAVNLIAANRVALDGRRVRVLDR